MSCLSVWAQPENAEHIFTNFNAGRGLQMFVDMLQLCQYEKMTGTLREDLHDNVYQKEMKTNDSTRIITLFLHFRTCVVYALVTRDCCA
jgi:hypothetical protein